jgi:nucleoside-diphosphate-sugar epimerase
MSLAGTTVAITGASGFVGRHLCRHFLARGCQVRGLVRDTRAGSALDPRVERFCCDLPGRIDVEAFREVAVLIHCAYTSRFVSPDQARRVNEEGTARVLALSRENGVGRFVFVSSTSAHPDARSYYGKSKLALEGRLDPARDLIVRPGLVLGPDGGLFQRLVASLRRTGVLPLFGGGRQPVQTVHVDDLCVAVGRAIERGLTGTYVVAEPDGMPLRELLQLVARKLGRRAVALPLPAGPVLACLRVTEALRLPLPISSENVLGALSLRSQPSARDLDAIGVRLRGAAESLDQLLGPTADGESTGPDRSGP